MKCIVIQTSPERISAEPVTNEDGTPYIYATMKEARAELKANGYIYNRANQRYYINGTEYRAYVIREDSEEYAEIMEQAEEEAAPEYIEPEHIQTVSGHKIFRSIDPVTGWSVFTIAGRDFWELAEARYFAQCNPAAEPEHEAAHNARIAAASVIDAYAEAEGISPADVTAEQYAAAYAVAAAEIIGTDKEATEEQRATVAAMVEAIAERTHAAEAIEDAREAWDGPDYYRIVYSDGPAYGEMRYYETSKDLARDLVSAYQSATETHLPYAERYERPTYQRYELEAYLGDPDAYDVEAIEFEATAYTADGALVWAAFGSDLAAICERHELYEYAAI